MNGTEFNGATPAGTREDEKLVVLEFCCSDQSLLGQTAPKNTEVIRLTADDDMTTVKGMAKAVKAIRGAKRIAMWGSLPCTGGSLQQNANIYNVGHKEKMLAHWKLFKSLFGNFVKLARMIRAKGGSISMELPRGNRYWSYQDLNDFLDEMNMNQLKSPMLARMSQNGLSVNTNVYVSLYQGSRSGVMCQDTQERHSSYSL